MLKVKLCSRTKQQNGVCEYWKLTLNDLLDTLNFSCRALPLNSLFVVSKTWQNAFETAE